MSKRSWSLQLSLLLLQVVSLVLSAWLLLVVAPRQLGIGLELLLTVPVRDRLQVIGEGMGVDVGPALVGPQRVDLGRYDAQHGVRFSIYDGDGFELAGPDQTLPTDVMEEIRTTRALIRSEAPAGTSAGPGGRAAELPAWPLPSRRLLLRSSFVLPSANGEDYWIGIRTPIFTGDGGFIPATIIVHAGGLWSAARFLSFTGWLAYTATLGLLLLLWLPVLRAVSRTVRDITRATQRLAQEDFAVRLGLSRNDELGRLADSVDTVAARLQSFMKGQKQFVSNLTHELCAPIARLQVGLELLSSHVVPEGVKTFEGVQEEAETLRELAADLLAFARANSMDSARRTALVSVRALVLSVLDREKARNGVEVCVPADLTLTVNAVPLERAIANLVRNAQRYAGTENGPIEVVAENRGKVVCIRVLDRGPGVPPLSLINLGNAFYRPELGRKRKRPSGGLGLGLATVKHSVVACGGSIAFRNREGGGFEAEILVPRLPQVD